MKRIALATDDDNPIEQAKTYLTTMFGHIEHGYVTFHGLDADDNWRPDIHVADLTEPNSLVDAAARCLKLSAEGMNVYVATSVMGVAAGRREAEATYTPALIAEFDRVTSSDNKENAWETLQEVENFLDGLRVPASMIVESGNGWHAYWLLDEPLDWTEFDALGDRTIAKRTLARFLGWLKSEAPHDMDSVADGARVFRVPGTVNRKYGEAKPVAIEKLEPAVRYSAKEIADEIIPVDVAVTHSFSGSAVDIQLSDIEEWMNDSVSVQTARGAEILTEALGRMRAHSDRHPSMRDAVSYLVQDAHRRDVNMPQALQAMSDRFDEIKPEDQQVPPKRRNNAGNVIAGEFMDTAKWVVSLRVAEHKARIAELAATSAAVVEMIPVDETLGDTPPFADTRMAAATPAEPLQLVDWKQVAEGGKVVGWVVPNVIERGRMTTIQAQAGSGKSLISYGLVLDYAQGRNVLGGDHPTGEPMNVLYIDYEMSDYDLNNRTESFGYDTAKMGEEVPTLKYALYPQLAPLNTREGGEQLVEACRKWEIDLLVIDTMTRAISGGGENEDQPWRDAFRYAWTPIKALGITILRLDHLGKDTSAGGRGSSAKRDEADMIWTVTQVSSTEFRFKIDKKRTPVEHEQFSVKLDTQGARLSFTSSVGDITMTRADFDIVRELDAANVPEDMPYRTVKELYGISAQSGRVTKCQKYRRRQIAAQIPRGASRGAPESSSMGANTGSAGEQTGEQAEALTGQGKSEGSKEGEHGGAEVISGGEQKGVSITPFAPLVDEQDEKESEAEQMFREALTEVAAEDEMKFGDQE